MSKEKEQLESICSPIGNEIVNAHKYFNTELEKRALKHFMVSDEPLQIEMNIKNTNDVIWKFGAVLTKEQYQDFQKAKIKFKQGVKNV